MLIQLLINSLVAGSEIALVGVGFALAYRTTRFIDFSLAALIPLGAYAALAARETGGLPIAAAVCVGGAGAGLVSVGLSMVLYGPLERKGAKALVLLLASIGVGIILQNIMSMIWGDDARSISGLTVVPGIEVFGARVSKIRIAIFGVAVAALLGMHVLLHMTRVGIRLRGIGSSRLLATAAGLRIGRDVAVGSGLAGGAVGLGGALFALDVGVSPTSGVSPLIAGILAVLIAGGSNVGRIVSASLLLGIVEQATAWRLGTQWQDLVSLVALIVVSVSRLRKSSTRTQIRSMALVRRR